MSITRRQALGSAGAAIAASSLAKPAIAVNEPIRVGYLPALTGPSSSTGIGINRGTQLAVQELNAAGGINGRQIELITRDTQSDPTKAVNGAAELSRGQNVSVVFGPVNSGESLAVVPLLARTNTPQIHPCWVDTLTDPQKYPMCFRNAPTNQQIGAAANRYVVEVLKRKKVAVISDTTGYGTASVNAYVPMLQAMGAEVVYQGNVDAANPDLKPELGGGGSHHALERQCRFSLPHHQHARQYGLGRADRRPDHTRLRSDKSTAGKARILGEGLPEQFPQRLLRPGRKTSGAHHRLRRPSEERQDRHGRHALVVDSARL
jgi:hypothetical protein